MPEYPQLSPGDQDCGSACQPPRGPMCVCVFPPAWCPAGVQWVPVLVGQAGQGPCRCRGWPAQAAVLRGPCCSPAPSPAPCVVETHCSPHPPSPRRGCLWIAIPELRSTARVCLPETVRWPAPVGLVVAP